MGASWPASGPRCPSLRGDVLPMITPVSFTGRLLRYCLMSVGDCPVGAINSEKLSVYKRHLLDRGLSAATIATMLSGLRSFLRYLRDIRGLATYDPAKVRRPAIPKREVDYLSKEEMQ